MRGCTAALLVLLVLPSCFTQLYWQGGVRPDQEEVAIVGTRVLFDSHGVPASLQLPLAEVVAASWPWPDCDRPCWLVVGVTRDQDEFAALLARKAVGPLPRLRVAVSGVRLGHLVASLEWEQRSWASGEVALSQQFVEGALFEAATVELVRPVFHRAPLLLRIAGTPFTVVADVLAFPLLLPWTYPLAIEMGVATW
jgi:hypothetical protein